ncbi:hypothetical protein [Flavobacterium tructae]|uniref:Uncharacterized protein n=1 Tax=Flavobacterium tructae TaxID=1114873 RepID=A0A1S1J4L8_9FLAO|nr:hypothetical protein [Flavobacterium tructae]OHT44419.1 hypothetical protein BHE19_11910 [Flavobacterium tructae]OXB19445.1 hypothetical protein B0A71_12965 [Flavobacterium tructae]
MNTFNKDKFVQDYEIHLKSQILQFNKIENPTKRDEEIFYPDADKIYLDLVKQNNLKIHSDELEDVYSKTQEINNRLFKLIKPAK